MIEQPARWMRKLYPHATWRMDPEEHAVYLTFDDGPIPEATPFILKTLADFDVKATFFMVGDNVRKFPHLYQQVKDAGHQIGNHTMNHLGSFRHWTTTYVINVFQANELIHSHLFRPPHGWMRHSVYYWIKKYYRVVFWDVVNNVKRLTRNGSIITFHDSLKSIDKLYTALPESLQWLKDQGYEFKVIP